jgi:flagella basal body P-ring formation protein FlgA
MRKVVLLTILILFLIPFNASSASFYTYDDFKNLFLKEIKKELTWVKGKIVLEKFRIEPENIKIPKNAFYKIKFLSTPSVGSNFILVTFFNRRYKQIGIARLWGYVEAKVPVVVVIKPIRNKEIIKAENLGIEFRALSRLPQDVIIDKKSAIGKQARISLKPGTVLRMSYIDLPIVIKRNQQVNIIARGKYFIVKAKGKALQNGRLGEIIRVRNIDSKKTIWAKVISSEEVEVIF